MVSLVSLITVPFAFGLGAETGGRAGSVWSDSEGSLGSCWPIEGCAVAGGCSDNGPMEGDVGLDGSKCGGVGPTLSGELPVLRVRPGIIGPMSSPRRRGEAGSLAEEGTVADED